MRPTLTFAVMWNDMSSAARTDFVAKKIMYWHEDLWMPGGVRYWYGRGATTDDSIPQHIDTFKPDRDIRQMHLVLRALRPVERTAVIEQLFWMWEERRKDFTKGSVPTWTQMAEALIIAVPSDVSRALFMAYHQHIELFARPHEPTEPFREYDEDRGWL